MTLASLRHNDAREVRTLRRARSMSFCSRLALIVGLATLCDATLKPLEASSIVYSTLASDGTYINTGYVVGVSGSLGIDHDVAAPFTPSMDAILA
jgi:hypothetical protein